MESGADLLEIGSEFVEGTLPGFRIGDTEYPMAGEQKLYGSTASLQDPWGTGMNNHPMGDGCVAGADQGAGALYLHHADTAITRGFDPS